MKFFKSKPDLPPGMNPEYATSTRQQPAATIPGKESEVAGLSKSAKRNMKRKEKRKQNKCQQEPEGEMEEVTKELEKVSVAAEEHLVSADLNAATTEKAKKIKNLRKKLRQAEELQQKVDLGELQNPSNDQLDKLSRAQALREELRQLEDS